MLLGTPLSVHIFEQFQTLLYFELLFLFASCLNHLFSLFEFFYQFFSYILDCSDIIQYMHLQVNPTNLDILLHYFFYLYWHLS